MHDASPDDVLKQRLAAIRHRDPDRPFSVGLYSRLSPSPKGYCVCHDFTSYFDGRDASSEAYPAIEVALADSAAALAATGSKVRISARGNASLPLGVLFGAIYSPLAFGLEWLQPAPGADEQMWSLACGPSNARPTIRISYGGSEFGGLGVGRVGQCRRGTGCSRVLGQRKPLATSHPICRTPRWTPSAGTDDFPRGGAADRSRRDQCHTRPQDCNCG